MRAVIRRLWVGLVVMCGMGIVGLTSAHCSAAEGSKADIQKAREKALNYLRTSQADDGSWTTNATAGITGLVVTAALRNGVKTDDPMVQKGLKNLESYIQPDGGIYSPKTNFRNYETCIVLLALKEANSDGKFTKTIANADKFLRKEQIDEDDDTKKSDAAYGGAGYGPKSRPDLSNTQFLLDALQAAGAKPDDPAVQKALIFVSRSQNLESEHNTTEFAAKVNDGGFYYTPVAGGASAAGKAENPDKTDNGGLRSYGTMTYAGLKSMLYAGVGPDDPRVKAASGWIRKNYSVEQNPGMGQAGLYYYYHTFAKALDAMKLDEVEDGSGKKHNWRQELASELIKTQKDNGSWVNSDRRWNEADPNLATAFSLLALSYCDK